MRTTTSPPALDVTGLRKSFGDTVALDGIDLRVDAGSIFALLGRNGAGKTTTVQILSTLIRADAGEVRVAGHDPVREPDAVRKVIGVTGQSVAVDGLLTGGENLTLWPTCATSTGPMADGGSPSCSSGSIWPRRRGSPSPRTPAACAGGSTSR